MKKILLLILSLLLCLAVCISCAGKEDSGDQNDSGSQSGGANDGPSGGDVPVEGTPIWSEGEKTLIVVTDSDRFDLVGTLSTHVYDASGIIPDVKNSDASTADGRIIVGDNGSEAAKKAYKRLDDFANLAGLLDAKRSAWLIYAENGTMVIAYSDTIAKKQVIDYIAENYDQPIFAPKNGTVAKAVFDIEEYLSELRAEEQEPYFNDMEKVLGSEAAAAFRKLYSIYDEDLYVWIANLWCPDNGGFYYSASARNNEGFLPDLESTGQALGTLDRSGLSAAYGGNWADLIPDEIKAKLLNFAREMQAEDHYFYHPQWGTGINRSRRGRDAGWARTIITGLGGTPKYPFLGDTDVNGASYLTPSLRTGASVTAVSKVVAVAASDAVYATKESFIAYLDSLKFNENSYAAGNVINSTTGAIRIHGHMETLRQYLTEHQNPHNGLWEDEVSYQSVNGLMKLCTCFGSSFPNAEKALDSAMQILMQPLDDELTGITFVYNPWVAIANLLNAVSDEKEAELKKTLRDNAKEIFLMTAEKLSAFSKLDGGFSYLRDYSSPFSQDVLVAVSGSAESDVNATSIAISTVVRYMEEVFGLTFPPLYSKYEGAYFVDLLESMGTIIKDSLLAEDPEIIIFDDYEEEDVRIDGNVILEPHHSVYNNIGDTEADSSGYIWFESALVPNPKKEAGNDDIVLYAADKVKENAAEGEKAIADTASSTVFKITNLGAPGNCYVFEADMLFGGTSDTSAPVGQLTFIREGTALISAWVDFYQYSRGGKQYLRIQEYVAGKDGVKDKEVVAGIPVDDWFKLRVEMYKDYSGEGGELNIMLKFYVNGEFAGVCDAGLYEKGAYKDFLVSAVRLSYYRHAASAFYLDNIYVAKKNYTFELDKMENDESDKTVSDKKVYDFENGLVPGGPDNWTEMYYKDEDLGQTMINAADWNEGLESQYGGTKSPGAKVYVDADPENAANKVLRAYSYNTKVSSYKATMRIDDVLTEEGGKTWEVEFDYYFDKIGWLFSGEFFSLEFQNANGSAIASMNFEGLGWEDSHNTEMMGITLSDGQSFDNFALYDATWYTFKVVYHYDEAKPSESKILVYVLGTAGYQCIINTTLYSKVGVITNAALVFHCYDIRGTQYVDDISVSRTNREYSYDKPIEGEIDIPVGEDNKIYIEDSQRGNGVYYENSQKYTGASYAELIKIGVMAQNTKRGNGVEDGNRELKFTNIDGGNALAYTSLASGNHTLGFVANEPGVTGFIFETDIKLSGVDSEEGRDIRFTGSSNLSADSSLYAFNLKFHKNPNDRKGGYIVTVNGSDQKVVIKDNVWINARLVAEGTSKGDPLKLYINGTLVIETTLNDNIKDIKGVELYTPSTYNGHGWEQGSIYLDNTYLTGTGYVAPDVITSTQRGEGKNAGSAISYDGVTYEKLISDGFMANNTARGDGVEAGKRTLALQDVGGSAALVYSAIGSGNHSINFKNENDPHYGFLFETDMKLSGITNAQTRKISFVGTSSNGTANAGVWGVNIGFCVNTETDDGGYLVTVNGSDWKGIVADDTWFNIRFESTSLVKDGAFSLYINGEKVCEGSLTSDIKSIKGIELYTPSTADSGTGFVEGKIYLDNTYVTGTMAPTESVTSSSRGEGKNAGSAISYDGVTYEELISSGKMIQNSFRGDGVEAGKRTLSLVDLDGNKALKYSSIGSGNHALDFALDGKVGAGLVFETDIMLSGIDASRDRAVTFYGTSNNGTATVDVWSFAIKLYANPIKSQGGTVLEIAGSSYLVVIPDNTWINLRVEYKGTKMGEEFDVYINDAPVASGHLSGPISSMTAVELYTQSTYNGKQGMENGSIYLDNTYVHAIPASDTPGDNTPGDTTSGVITGENMDNAWDVN